MSQVQVADLQRFGSTHYQMVVHQYDPVHVLRRQTFNWMKLSAIYGCRLNSARVGAGLTIIAVPEAALAVYAAAFQACLRAEISIAGVSWTPRFTHAVST